MKKEISKKQAHDVYAIANSARLNSLKKNEDKTAVLKVLRELRTIAKAYGEDADDAREKLKPEGYDEMLQKAVAYEQELRSGKMPLAMTAADYQQFVATAGDYDAAVRAAMEPEGKKMVELEFDPLQPSVLEELMTANNWTVEQYFFLEDILTKIK